jgi:hypothetical protein
MPHLGNPRALQDAVLQVRHVIVWGVHYEQTPCLGNARALQDAVLQIRDALGRQCLQREVRQRALPPWQRSPHVQKQGVDGESGREVTAGEPALVD